MDEKIPPLATYPPPKTPKANKGTSPIIFLVAGVVLGGALVLAAVKATNGGSDRRLASNTPLQSAKPQVIPNEPVPAPGASNVEPGPKPGASQPEKKLTDKEKELLAGGGAYNPFEGNISVGPPASEMSGHIDSSGPPPVGPGSNGSMKTMGNKPFGDDPKVPNPDEETVPRGYLAIIRLDVENPETAVSAIRGVASKVGGAAIQFDETAKRLEPEGAILFVPLAKAEAAQRLLGSVGSVVVSDTWNGSSGARLDKIESEAQSQLSDLRIKRQELLVKYFEDAPQIKHIDEDTERINKCIGALRAQKPGPATAVFKIKFLG